MEFPNTQTHTGLFSPASSVSISGGCGSSVIRGLLGSSCEKAAWDDPISTGRRDLGRGQPSEVQLSKGAQREAGNRKAALGLDECKPLCALAGAFLEPTECGVTLGSLCDRRTTQDKGGQCWERRLFLPLCSQGHGFKEHANGLTTKASRGSLKLDPKT